jgi:hypothetical protein
MAVYSTDGVMDEVIALLRGLKGAVDAARVDDESRRIIGETESRAERAGFLPISNLGIRIILQRESVLVLLKDREFRPPPRPTVYMVEEIPEKETTEEKHARHLLTVGGKTFLILGEEVMNRYQHYDEDARKIGDGFVFFPERRSSAKTPSYFLIPPIAFAELDERSEELRIREVWSVSPSALTDQYIRTTLGFPIEDAYATILIGYDSA